MSGSRERSGYVNTLGRIQRIEARWLGARLADSTSESGSYVTSPGLRPAATADLLASLPSVHSNGGPCRTVHSVMAKGEHWRGSESATCCPVAHARSGYRDYFQCVKNSGPPIQSAAPKPGLTPLELAQDLVARIEQGNAYARSEEQVSVEFFCHTGDITHFWEFPRFSSHDARPTRLFQYDAHLQLTVTTAVAASRPAFLRQRDCCLLGGRLRWKNHKLLRPGDWTAWR